MTRYVVDPQALLDLVRGDREVAAVKIRLLGDRVSRRSAWRLARTHGWDTLRSAEYLAVATLQADALVAADPELAALARGVVPLAKVSALYVG